MRQGGGRGGAASRLQGLMVWLAEGTSVTTYPEVGMLSKRRGPCGPAGRSRACGGAGSREAEPSRTPGRALCRGFRME